MKIAHLSDIHFFRNQFKLSTLFSKRLLGTLNHYMNPKRHSVDFDLFELPEVLKAQGVTHVVISGDFTTTSNVKEYQLASHFLKKLEDQGFKIFAIPGNHDHYTRQSDKTKRFYQFIKASIDLKEKGISYEDFGDGFKCILLDTVLATPCWSSQGLFSKNLEKRLSNLLNSIPKEQPLIVINHFPVVKGNRPQRHQMVGLEALRSLLESHSNIVLYLHGHTHISEFSTTKPLMINSGSLTLTKGGSFHIMDLTDEFLEVEAYTYHDNTWKVRIKKSFPVSIKANT